MNSASPRGNRLGKARERSAWERLNSKIGVLGTKRAGVDYGGELVLGLHSPQCRRPLNQELQPYQAPDRRQRQQRHVRTALRPQFLG